MEIPLILGASAALDAGLLFYLLAHRRLRQPFLLLAVALSLFALLQSLRAYFEQHGLVVNHYSQVLVLYAWLLYLQSLYLQIPNRPLARYLPLAIVNLLLFSLFLFQFRIDQISGNLFFDTTTLRFAGIFTSIAMLFFLENLIRHLKVQRRYAYKHLLYALIVLALVELLYYYQSVSYHQSGGLLLYLVLMVQLPLPLFVGISAARIRLLEPPDFIPGKGGQAQYFMILIGAGLLLAGVMQMLDYYFSEVRSDFYHAVLALLLTFGLGLLMLSDLMRSEINQWLRAYFLGDATDYKREWSRVSRITRHEEGIEQEILGYLMDCLGCHEGALYLADRQRLVLVAVRGEGFGEEFRLLEDWERETEPLGEHVHRLKSSPDGEGEAHELLVLLRIDERIQGLARLRCTTDPRLIDDSVLSLCETVGNAFAIRLGEIQQKRRLQRQEKLAGFNRTVAFLAHDLKNIVAQQKLAVENFPKYREDPEFLDDFCETIEHSTQKLEDLFAQFRYKSLNSGSEAVSFRRLMEFLLKKQKVLGPRLKLELPLEDADLPAVPADLLVVADNLLKNALEASPADTAVSVRLECLPKRLRLEVCDRGEGMTDAFIRDRLFEPFDSTKSGSGLGIGMYHVRSIVESLQGRIQVDSEPGQGTCITVETALG